MELFYFTLYWHLHKQYPYFSSKEVNIGPGHINILYEITQMCLNVLILQTSHGIYFTLWSFKKWLGRYIVETSWRHQMKCFPVTHYSGVMMRAMASHSPAARMICSAIYSGADQRKRQSSASLAFVRGIHWWPVNFPHKKPVTRKRFPFGDVIMGFLCAEFTGHRWIPLTKDSDGEHWCFLWSAPEQTVEETIEMPVIWDAIPLIMTSL